MDVYVLGVKEPVENFTGVCVAIIHRNDDDDDKLVIVPDGQEEMWIDADIMREVSFQEKWFDSEVIRA